jgi:hypothetical protein
LAQEKSIELATGPGGRSSRNIVATVVIHSNT